MPNVSTEQFGTTGGQIGPAEAEPGFFDTLLESIGNIDFGGAISTGIDILTAGSPILGLFGLGGQGESLQPVAQPGGAPIFQLPAGAGGASTGGVGFAGPSGIIPGLSQLLGIGPGGGGVLPGGAMPNISTSLLAPGQIPTVTRTTQRLPATLQVPHVTATGQQKIVTYKNMGRAILFTGDLAACRRVRKVAARARRRVGGR